MNCQDMETLLNDYADGTLASTESRQVETHLQSCPGCRQDLEAIRALLTAAGELPRELTPGRDLWPGIATEVGSGSAAEPGSRGLYGSHRMLAGLAVAATLLVATVLVITMFSGAPVSERPLPDSVSGHPPVTEQTGHGAVVETILELRREHMAPATYVVLKDNLDLINAVERETRMAMAENPHDSRLSLVLASIYRKKIELLERALRLSV